MIPYLRISLLNDNIARSHSRSIQLSVCDPGLLATFRAMHNVTRDLSLLIMRYGTYARRLRRGSVTDPSELIENFGHFARVPQGVSGAGAGRFTEPK